MAVFNSGRMEVTLENTFDHPEQFTELMIADEVANMTQEELEEFCAPGGLGEQLVQEGKLRNRTLVRLSKKDDLTRRTKMATYELAKQSNDPAWRKFVEYRQKALDYEKKMYAKYASKGARVAAVAQKNFLRGDKDVKTGLDKKFGADDR